MKKLVLLFALYLITGVVSAQVTIQGKVIVDDGKSPENVKVVFEQTTPAVSLDSVYTDTNGNFSISIISGIYSVYFSKNGYESLNVIDQSFYVNKTISDVLLVSIPNFDFSGKIKGIINPGTYIASNISLDINDTLLIKPGVTIKFYKNCKFEVNGKLTAKGTEIEPIKFTANKPSEIWQGVINTNSNSKFNNVIFEYADIGLNIDKCKNILLQNITSQYNNSGIKITNSSSKISNSFFYSNKLCCGLFVSSSDIKVFQSIFKDNIYIKNCVYGCYTGGGIGDDTTGAGSVIQASNCIFINNKGYEINSVSSERSCEIYNSIFYNEDLALLAFSGEKSSLKCENNLFYNSMPKSYDDQWLGNSVAINRNGIASDPYGNLMSTNPLFVDFNNNNFELQSGSPCIDAGKVLIDSLMLYDKKNNCRFFDGNSNGKNHLDIGLYEYGSKFKTVIPISIGNDSLICRNSSTILTPDVLLGNYVWSTGETSSQITIKNQGEYSVYVSNDNSFGIANKFLLASSGLFAKDVNFNKGDIIYGSIYYSENPVVFVDIDNDDDMDVIFETNDININSRLNWMRNDKGKFLFMESSFEASRFSNIAVSDIDNDGNIEIIVSMNDSIVVFSYKDNKLFNVKKKFLGSFRSIVDFNNDGLIDLYTIGSAYGSNWGVACINKGNLNFENITTPLIPATKWIDFDNDGYKDGFYKNLISKNNRNLTFTIDTVKVAPDAYISDIVDFNNDGLIDVISHNSEDISQVKISRNDGDCKFSDVPVAFNSTKDTRFLPIDYNNDGMTDVFNQSDASIFENDGNFNFTKKETKIEIGARSLKSVDLNGDNSSDIYDNGVYNFESVNGSYQIYSGQSFLNNECKKNTQPLPPTDVKVVLNGDTIKLTWDKGSDLEQGQNGLGYNFYIGSAPGKDDIVGSNSNLLTGFRKIVDYGNASLDTFAIIVRNLPTGKYYVAVQSIDNSFIGSKFSDEVSFSTKYNIILTTNPTVGGSVSGGGYYDFNSVQTVTATPNAGYTFSNWTEDGIIVSTSASYTFTVTGSRNLIANFVGSSYLIDATANPSIGGTITGTGSYWIGTSCTLTALPNNGYVFSKWTEGGTLVSTSSSYTFNVSGNRTLTANFSVDRYKTLFREDFSSIILGDNISTTSSPTAWPGNENFPTVNSAFQAGGSVKIGSSKVSGSIISRVLDLSANGGDFFLSFDVKGWTTVEGDIKVSVTGLPEQIVTYNAVMGGSFENKALSFYGGFANSTIKIETTAKRAYIDNVEVYYADTTSSAPIAVISNPTIGGIVSGGGTYKYGTSCTINAVPNTGYTFTNWTENGTIVSTNASYVFNVTANRTLVANFTINNYSIAASASPGAGGTITGTGAYNHGSSCTITATANTGYTFTNWTENGTIVSTNASYVFNVTANRTLVANFTINNYSIAASASPGAGGTITGTGAYNHGSSCTITATANTGYTFTNWTENGTIVSTNASYVFNVTANRILVANFNLIIYEIKTSIFPDNAGTTNGAGNYTHGTTINLTASANTGYEFLNWSENNIEKSKSAIYNFMVTENRTLVANFISNTSIPQINIYGIKVYSIHKNAIIENASGWQVRVIDVRGRTILIKTSESDKYEIQIPVPGLYLIQLSDKDKVCSEKVIIK